jgi:hypothetical protein
VGLRASIHGRWGALPFLGIAFAFAAGAGTTATVRFLFVAFHFSFPSAQTY